MLLSQYGKTEGARVLVSDNNFNYMKNSEFDYQPEKDDLPRTLTFWIIVAALAAAVYLSQVLV